jgi:hypothetical protein
LVPNPFATNPHLCFWCATGFSTGHLNYSGV